MLFQAYVEQRFVKPIFFNFNFCLTQLTQFMYELVSWRCQQDGQPLATFS